MTTEQQDARTTALRDELHREVARIVQRTEGLTIDGEQFDAALDALTQHHEAIGAVRALEAAPPCILWLTYTVDGIEQEVESGPTCADYPSDSPSDDDLCTRCRELAAWRKRLAGEEL